MEKQNTPNTDDLAKDVNALAPPTEVVAVIDGHEFTFRPLRVKQFFPFLAIARPLFAALAKASSPPSPGLPPAPAPGQGGDPSAAHPMGAGGVVGSPAADAQGIDVAALSANTDGILELLETHGPEAIRALAVAIEPDQSPEAQAVMQGRLEDLTVVGLLVAFRHFVTLNAGFFAAQGLRLTPGGMLGAPATDADRARAGSAAAVRRPGTQPRRR